MEHVRRILHVDMDAFFASVEQHDNPELRGRPVLVGGSKDGRGVVAAASYEARKFGIRSAMPSRRAYRLCPEAIFVKPRFARYQEISRKVMDIFLRYSDLVEPLSLDEAFIDVTQNKLAIELAMDVAKKIKADILDETGLTASAGVAPNKFLAKIASGYRKPNGLTVIAPEKVEKFLEHLSLRDFPGVGPATEARLHELGIRTSAELRARSEIELREALGKFGGWLFRVARGQDDRTVNPTRERKSLGAESTFHEDQSGIEGLSVHLDRVASRVAERLLAKGLSGATITLKVKFANFEVITRSITLNDRVCESEDLLRIASSMLEATEAASGRAVRLLGIQVSSFDKEVRSERQLSLPLSPRRGT